MANELINGLMQLAQRNSKGSIIGSSPPTASFPVGVIPAGSTDALVCTTTGTNCAVTSALHIAIGDYSSEIHSYYIIRYHSLNDSTVSGWE